MSILIKGMEMPTSCNECRFFVDAWCYALDVDDWRNAYNKPREGERLPGCPLIPVPDHGRLIDADALLQECQRDEAYGYISAFEIDNAPTIIPASGGDAE